MRRLGLAAVVGASLTAGCSSGASNTDICCYTWNGVSGSYSCPNQAAFTACCGATPTTEPGCVTDPGTCTPVSPSECP